MNAVIYARYSSDQQRQESIDAQVHAIEKYAKQHNYIIVDKYIDEAMSARTDNRPSFQQMMNDCENGTFSYVIVHKLDRFSRDRYDSAVYKKKLKDNNIKLISVTENLDGSPESVILESLLEGMSEYYSKNLARETLKGLFENARQCKHTGGYVPFGYNLDKDKRYIINEYEAIAVKQIFEMYTQGLSYTQIIDWLNENNYKTKNGRCFYKSALLNMIKNKKYTGVFIFNKNNKNNKEDILEIKNGMPRIITDEVFYMAEEIREQNKRTNRRKKAKSTYVLTGKLVCGVCGSNMHGSRRKNGRGTSEYSSYMCPSVRKKTCDKKGIKKDDIEYSVFSYLENSVFNDEYINKLAGKIQDEYNRLSEEVKPKINTVTKKMNNIDTKIDNMLDMVAEVPELMVDMKAKILKLKDEKQQLEKELALLNINTHEEFTTHEIIKFLSLGKNIMSKPDKEKAIIIDTFVKEIKIDKKNESVELTLHSPSTNVVDKSIAGAGLEPTTFGL